MHSNFPYKDLNAIKIAYHYLKISRPELWHLLYTRFRQQDTNYSIGLQSKIFKQICYQNQQQCLANFVIKHVMARSGKDCGFIYFFGCSLHNDSQAVQKQILFVLQQQYYQFVIMQIFQSFIQQSKAIFIQYNNIGQRNIIVLFNVHEPKIMDDFGLSFTSFWLINFIVREHQILLNYRYACQLFSLETSIFVSTKRKNIQNIKVKQVISNNNQMIILNPIFKAFFTTLLINTSDNMQISLIICMYCIKLHEFSYNINNYSKHAKIKQIIKLFIDALTHFKLKFKLQYLITLSLFLLIKFNWALQSQIQTTISQFACKHSAKQIKSMQYIALFTYFNCRMDLTLLNRINIQIIMELCFEQKIRHLQQKIIELKADYLSQHSYILILMLFDVELKL